MESLIINPTLLTFLTTYTCTSSCKNCCFQCNPKRKEKLSVEDMISYIDKCIDSYSSIKMLVLSGGGGEAFLFGKSLEKIIRHATKAGLKTRIVTNGFWAKNYERTYKKIQNLIKAGLSEINFSTGDDHLEFVPIKNIINGALASLRQNITVAINVESAQSKSFESNVLLEDPDLKEYISNGSLKIINGLWISFIKNDDDHELVDNNSKKIKNFIHNENNKL